MRPQSTALTKARRDEERHGVGLFMRLLRLPQAIHYGRNCQIFSKNDEAHVSYKFENIIQMLKTCYLILFISLNTISFKPCIL